MPRSRVENREYMRGYMRERRAAQRGAGEVVSSSPASSVRASARSLVQRELDALPAAKGLLSLVAAALAMADVLDDSSAVPQHPAAAGQLRQVMAEIRSAKAPVAQSALSVIRGGRAG